MTLKIKRLSENAILPIRAHEGDAGIDLTCTRITQELNECGQLILVYHTDLAVEIPEGYVGLLFQRSSVYKKSISMTNAVGIIDAGYVGEIMGKFRSTTDVVPAVYQPGERFAQLVIVPHIALDIEEVTELSETDRGENGYGSTGTTNEDISAVSEDTQSSPESETVVTNSESEALAVDAEPEDWPPVELDAPTQEEASEQA